jgi:hypothetical protein
LAMSACGLSGHGGCSDECLLLAGLAMSAHLSPLPAPTTDARAVRYDAGVASAVDFSSVIDGAAAGRVDEPTVIGADL